MRQKNLYKNIDEDTILKLLEEKEGSTAVLVFTADWLGASQILDAFFREIAVIYQKELHIYRCDTAAMNGLPKKIGVETLPTTLIVQNGEIIDHFTGVLSKKNIKKKLEAVIGK